MQAYVQTYVPGIETATAINFIFIIDVKELQICLLLMGGNGIYLEIWKN